MVNFIDKPLIYKNKISDRELSQILIEKDQYKNKATVAGLYNKGINKSIRDSLTYFPDPIESFQTRLILFSYILEYYSFFQIKMPPKFIEVQYTRYYQSGFFKWHQDIVGLKNGSLSNRLLTFSINLTEPTQYKGGELFVKTKKEVFENDKTPGSFVCFPSFLFHTASVVKNGTREAIVIWAHSYNEEISKFKTIAYKQGIY